MMTWLSFACRSLGLLVLLFLVVSRLSSAELAVFLLFNLLIGFRNFADLGFGPTFVRFMSYALGGARSLQPAVVELGTSTSGQPNLCLMGKVVGAMRQVYRWLTMLLFLAIGFLGTAAVRKQIQTLDSPEEGWLAWILVAMVTIFAFWATQFSVYLQGINRIAMLRRWEALFNLMGISSSVAVLLLGGGLLGVVASMQTWILLSCIRNALLARHVMSGWWRSAPARAETGFLAVVWPPAWRVGVGAGMSMGMVQLSGIILAQMTSGPVLATLLLALRFLAFIVELSQAPFYSKLPLYSQLFSRGDIGALLSVARRAMRLSYGAFLLGWILLGSIGPFLMASIGSVTPFPSNDLWALMGLAFLIHRFGAMHVQLCNAMNHVIMHIADGVSGVIYIIALSLLVGPYGIMAVPICQLGAYGGFYAWFAARNTYSRVNTDFVTFERTIGIPVALVALGYVAVHTLS
jgi:hypothetical protein